MTINTLDELLQFVLEHAKKQLEINEFMNLPEIKGLLLRVEINLRNKYKDSENKEEEFFEMTECRLYIMGEYIKCYNAVKPIDEEALKNLMRKLIETNQ